MFNNILKCLVLLSPFVLKPSEAFWWRSTTTEAPTPVMKQIPLTYFRTYTYQPMAGNPLPFPLMSSTDYISNYAALANNPYFNPMMSMLPQTSAAAGTGGVAVTTGGGGGGTNTEMSSTISGMRPAKSYAGVNVVRSLSGGHQIAAPTSTTTPEPTTTTTKTTSTTTTTTTTPAPTTTSTTTAATTTSTEHPSVPIDAGSNSGGPSIKAEALVNIETAYPAFNRKVYTNHFNINYNRPVYPYPEYSVYKTLKSPGNSLNEEVQSGASANSGPTANVEFVPCMCPVSLQGGYPAGVPITGNPSNSIFLAQSRTNADVEASMELPATDGDVQQADGSLTNFVDDLQVVNMDGADEDVTQSVVVAS